jgi:(1->4)-alpha-D-glucan 1-alpha-D-glucosylmutase
VPDLYQGDELEALALVDPDNRRPVDWQLRRGLLAEDAARDPKLLVTSRLLALRRDRPEAFAGGYMPVDAPPDVCAYMRGPDVLVVVPLAPSATADVSVKGTWHDVFDDRFSFRVYESK